MLQRVSPYAERGEARVSIVSEKPNNPQGKVWDSLDEILIALGFESVYFAVTGGKPIAFLSARPYGSR